VNQNEVTYQVIIPGAGAHCEDAGDPEDCAWWNDQGLVVFSITSNRQDIVHLHFSCLFIVATILLIPVSLIVVFNTLIFPPDTALTTLNSMTPWWTSVLKLAVVEVIRNNFVASCPHEMSLNKGNMI
jgi:hypothetical protein